MKLVIKSYHKKSALLLMLFFMAIAITTTAQSLKFNGTSQYARVPNNAALQLKSFTIEMWIRPEGTGVASANGSGSSGLQNVYPVLSKGRAEVESAAVDVNYYSALTTTNRIGFDFEDDATSLNHPITSNAALTSCVWQHVAASYNDTTGVWNLYINGVLDISLTLSQNFHPQSLSTVNLSFGSAVNSTNVAEGYFNGSLDEVRIWKRVRTAAEIAAAKNLAIASDADLAARYGLNDGSGTSAINSSSTGAAINATLFNTPVWNSTGFDASSAAIVGAVDLDGVNDHIVLGSAASLRATTFTLEGWIKMEGTGVTASSGTNGIVAVPIITKGRGESETAGVNMNYFLGIDPNANNVLVADFEEASGPNHKVIGNTPLQQNVWYHVAATYGSDGIGGKEWKLYINGVLDKQQTEAGAPTPEPNSAQHSAIGTAMNSGGTTEGFFNGKIDEVRIWNVVRSGTDIANNYLNQLTSGTGLIGRWGFNECSGTAVPTSVGVVNGTLTGGALRTVSNYNPAPSEPTNAVPVNGAINYEDGKVTITVADRNSQNMTVKLFGRKKVGQNSTIIALPDTQFYTEEPQGTNSSGGGNNAIFKAQTQWIADHRVDSNIAFVVELGDCVQNGNLNEIEWKRADTAMKNIENPNVPITHGIPYTISVGNHDQGATGNGDPNAATTFYNQYFGEARFLGRSYYGGHYGSNNDNNYQLFTAGGIDFIHFSIEYNNNSGATNQATLQGVLDWVDALLKAYPNRKGILSTHWLMGTGVGGAFQGPGQKIYDDLKDNPNLILMLAGHVAGQGRRTDVFNGNTVHTLMSDYQSGYTNGGNGYLRIMQLKPSTNTISVRTYSPTAGALPNATEIANGNFDLSVNLSNNAYALIATETNVASGSPVDLVWPNREVFTEYEWYVSVSDGENEISSQVYSFTTAGIVPVSLLQFTGKAESKRINLNWKTATEGQSKRFDVERSEDGKNFSKIGEVAAKGTSNSIQQYNSFDPNPLTGINHYRLKMVNEDESFTYSRIIHVSTNDKAKGFDIYPNPVSGNDINIVFTEDVKGKATIKVYDINGRLRINTQQTTNNNNLQLKHNLSPGLYVIAVTVNNREESRKIIIE